MSSIGEELVFQLAKRGVDTVFGIPGVHTIELYRGLAASAIRHVTPRCLSPLELCQYILAKGVRKHGSKALF